MTATHTAPTLLALDPHPIPDRWTSLPWCIVWALWSVGTRHAAAERLTRRVAAHCGVTEPTAPAPTLLAVDDVPLPAFLERFGSDQALGAVANRQRMWTRPDAPTKAATALSWADLLVSRGVPDLYCAGGVLDDAAWFAEIHQALGAIPGDRSGVRRCAFWTAVAADHQVRPDATTAAWLDVPVADLRPLVTRVAIDRSTPARHLTPRELDHALTRHRILG